MFSWGNSFARRGTLRAKGDPLMTPVISMISMRSAASGLGHVWRRFHTKDGVASLSDLARSSLRPRPDRIPLGKVRGPEALDLLKAWGAGHPGGIGTIHAGDALDTLRRLEQHIQEAAVMVPSP